MSHHECTVTMKNAYFWPPNFENKGFHCGFCLIRVSFLYNVPRCAFHHLHHTVRPTQTEPLSTHMIRVPRVQYGSIFCIISPSLVNHGFYLSTFDKA